jgi:hypothetical protein
LEGAECARAVGLGRSTVGLLRQVDAVHDVSVLFLFALLVGEGAARAPSKLVSSFFFCQGLVSRFTEIFSSKLGFSLLFFANRFCFLISSHLNNHIYSFFLSHCSSYQDLE